MVDQYLPGSCLLDRFFSNATSAPAKVIHYWKKCSICMLTLHMLIFNTGISERLWSLKDYVLHDTLPKVELLLDHMWNFTMKIHTSPLSDTT